MNVPVMTSAGNRTWLASRDPTSSETTGSQNGLPIGAIEKWNFWQNTVSGDLFRNTDDKPDALVWQRVPPVRIQTVAQRSLNSPFQISANRDAFVSYSVDVSCVISLSSGQNGTVFLEIASDAQFTQNVQEIMRLTNGNSGSLSIGLNLTQAVTGSLSGFVPSGYYCRMRTSNNIGLPIFTYKSGQETLI